jgi:sulfotransferase famil protein
VATYGNDRLLFIHVPKTGGAWAADAMRAAGVSLEPEGDERHPQLRDLDRRGRFAFGFVREPMAWYRSMWQFQRRIRTESPGEEFPPFGLDPFVDLPFPDFVRASIRTFPGHVSEMYQGFVGPPESPIDFIGRYERLEDDLVQALRLAGQDFDESVLRSVPPVNTATAPAPRCPRSVRRQVRETERAAYERFYPELVRLARGSEIVDRAGATVPYDRGILAFQVLLEVVTDLH